jgi:hypothetical protein
MPSESMLEAAIDDLGGKAGAFEKLVGRWICAAPEFEGRFSNIQIRGRKRDQTVKGWPDAFAEGPDGGWDCVQATHSDDWPRQVRNDLARLRAREKPCGGLISGYVMVAWSHGPRDQDQLNRYRTAFAAAGVPREGIAFVFKGRLLDSLQDWRFAHLWRDVLGISPELLPFRAVEPDRGLIGIDAGSKALQPRPEEFRAGLVHRPSVFSLVTDRLESDGVAEVRGRGAAGKTVLAEHIAQWHLSRGAPRILDEPESPISAGPVYYLKLGLLEEGEKGRREPVNVFRRWAAENSLFIVDDVHLAPQVALDLLNEWRTEARGSKMLHLGREQSLYREAPGSPPAPPESEVPVLRLLVGLEDLAGVYCRLARQAGRESPQPPPTPVLREWLQLFQGDLVVFSVAVAARLPRLLRREWRLTESDASLEVKNRYLKHGLDPEERRDLLGLAVLAELELGAPLRGVRSGFTVSTRSGAVLQDQEHLGEDGEFQLAHAGLGKLLLTAADEADEPRDVNEWARADTSFALRLGVGWWAAGENRQATEALAQAVDSTTGLAAALASTPGATARNAIFALDALAVMTTAELDRRLASEAGEILSCLLDRPGRLGPMVNALRRSCPRTLELLLEGLCEESSVDALIEYLALADLGGGKQLSGWVSAVPELRPALGRRFGEPVVLRRFLRTAQDLPGVLGSRGMSFVLRTTDDPRETVAAVLETDPELVGTVARRVLDGRPVPARSAYILLRSLSTPLDEEMRRAALEPRFAERLASWVEGKSPTHTVGALRFANELDPGLPQAVEAAISPQERRRLVRRLRDEPATLRSAAYSRRISPLLTELVAEVEALGIPVPNRDRPRGRTRNAPPSAAWWLLELDPRQALYLDLNAVLGFVLHQHEDEPRRAAAAKVAELLRAPENRDLLVPAVAMLSPSDLCNFLSWARTSAPELEVELLEYLRHRANTIAFADRCLEGPVLFEQLAGLLEMLEARDAELVAVLVAHWVSPRALHRFTEACLRSLPTNWVTLLQRSELGRAVLADLEMRRWRHYWRTCEIGSVGWLRILNQQLLDHGRPYLCSDPVLRVLRGSEKADWRGGITLAHLAHLLSTEEAADEDLVLDFLGRIDHESLLGSNYEAASAWSIAHFLNTLRRRQGEAVVDAMVTDSLARRVRREVEAGWAGRSAEETGGLLALVGGLQLIDVPVFMSAPEPARVTRAIQAAVSDGQLTAGEFLLWVGLRRLLVESGSPMPIEARGLIVRQAERFRRAEPADAESGQINAQIALWLDRSLEEGCLLPS